MTTPTRSCYKPRQPGVSPECGRDRRPGGALLAVILLTLWACAPPAIHQINLDLGGRGGGVYDAANGIAYLDQAALAQWDAEYPGMAAWWTAHERGHGIFLTLGIDIGPGLVGQERGAQCVAAVLTGAIPGWTDDGAGYWVCPVGWVDRVRTAMVATGWLRNG